MSYAGLPPIQVSLQPPASGRAGTLLLVWLVLLAALVTASYFGVNWFAALPPPKNVGSPAANFEAYASTVWPGAAPTSDAYVTFLWDTANAATLAASPVAPNLQLDWPPPKGSRFRLAAYPFGSKSSGVFVWDVVKGVFETLNSYSDVATFPGWFISVYDKDYWPNCPYYDQNKGTSATQRCSPDFGMFQWIEVLRACYLMPGVDYPACDDGGHWFYHAPGSGIWYNLGATLVRYNKIDAVLFLMAQMAIAAGVAVLQIPTDMNPAIAAVTSAAAAEGLKTAYATCLEGLNLEKLNQTTWDALWAACKSQLASYMDARRGDADIFAAIRAIIKAGGGKKQQSPVPFIFYREQVNDGRAKEAFYVLTALLAGIVASALAVVFSLLTILSGLPLVPLLVFLGAAAGAAAYTWYRQLGELLAGMGFVTLQGGLAKRGATLDDVLTYLTEPSSAAERAERVKIQAFSGLPQTQVFDAAIETFASLLGYDTVVFFAQANKSGTYTVELVDVTHITVGGQFWRGGLCGGGADRPGTACDATTPLGLSRGGLCWPTGAGQKVDSPSIYQYMNWKAAKQQVSTLPTPDRLTNYTSEVTTLFTTNNRKACTCSDVSSPNVPQRCLNCGVESPQPTASSSLCTG